MKIVNKKEEPLCNRTLVTVEDDTPLTPSNAEVAAFVAKQMGCDESLVVMQRMNATYGKSYTTATAYVYADAKAKGHFQESTKHMKEAAKKVAEEAAKAAEEAKKAAEAAKAAAAEPKAEEPVQESA